MAFGIKREELINWKEQVMKGEIAFLTHYWQDDRFPGCYTVTKVGCSDINKLINWGKHYNLREELVELKEIFHNFDLFENKKKKFFLNEDKWFNIYILNL